MQRQSRMDNNLLEKDQIKKKNERERDVAQSVIILYSCCFLCYYYYQLTSNSNQGTQVFFGTTLTGTTDGADGDGVVESAAFSQ